MVNQQEPLDQLFAALADPSRRAMVDRLCSGPTTVSELARPLPMSLPAALQHLRVLERSGLVVTRKVGRVRSCSLRPQALVTVQQWLGDRRALWEQRFDRLGDLLAAEPTPPDPTPEETS